jgi:hypothetical protein
MNNNLWNISLPVKLFDDITTDNLFDFMCNDEMVQECLKNNNLFVINSQNNNYSMWHMNDVVGKVNALYMEGNNLFVNVDIFLSTPNGAITKELYDMLHTDSNPVFYLTPHGMKNGNKITNINAFTLWHQPSHGSLGNMNMLEYEGDDIK